MMRKHQQRGSALLMAMVIVTMVATLAASMVWMQWRSVQVESAERSMVQSQWVLRGFLDYGRIFLREDARTGGPDHLGEQWAVPLAEVSIAAFLAADKDNTEEAPEGFLSGQILDATARYNLYNLLRVVDDPVAIDPDQLAAFLRLCEYANVAPSVAQNLAKQFQLAMLAAEAKDGDLNAIGGEAGRRNAPLVPQTLDQLVWLGIDAGTIERLRPYVVMYPVRETVPINVNTASREVLAAIVPGLDLSRADRLIQARQSKPFKSLADMTAVLGTISTGAASLAVKSEYFELQGRMRLSDRILSQRYIVKRESDGAVTTLVENSVFGVESSSPTP